MNRAEKMEPVERMKPVNPETQQCPGQLSLSRAPHSLFLCAIRSVGGVSLCLDSHSQITTQRLNINYKCSANSSGLLLANSYYLN